MSDAVQIEERDGVAWVALNRPEKLNAINEAMLHGLLAAIAQVGRDPAIGAAVLHGHGRAFSAGGDITAMAGMDVASFSRTIDLYMQVAAAFRGCRSRSSPPCTARAGRRVRAGADLRPAIAADDAVFGLPDAPLGLSPTSGMTYLLRG